MSAPQLMPAFEAARRGPRWAEMDGYERRNVVSALLAEGHSATRIGVAVGASRNAILGFSHRNGLSGGGAGRPRPSGERAGASGRRRKRGVTLAGPAVGGKEFRTCGAAPSDPAAPGHPGSSPGQALPQSKSGLPDLDLLERADPGQSRDRMGGGFATADDADPLPAAPRPLPPPPEGGVTFLALTDEHCKRPLWPDGPVPKMEAQLFCGAPSIEGSSWCRACAGRLLAGAPQPATRSPAPRRAA